MRANLPPKHATTPPTINSYNYRLSNVLAAPSGHPGRGQLRVLEERVQARRRNFDYYHETFVRTSTSG